MRSATTEELIQAYNAQGVCRPGETGNPIRVDGNIVYLGLKELKESVIYLFNYNGKLAAAAKDGNSVDVYLIEELD